jgi:hypothetical protein
VAASQSYCSQVLVVRRSFLAGGSGDGGIELRPDDEGAACPLAVGPTGSNGRAVAVFVQHWISNDVILSFSYFRLDLKNLNVLWRLSLCSALIFLFRTF